MTGVNFSHFNDAVFSNIETLLKNLRMIDHSLKCLKQGGTRFARLLRDMTAWYWIFLSISFRFIHADPSHTLFDGSTPMNATMVASWPQGYNLFLRVLL
jgi:hypothetical protein